MIILQSAKLSLSGNGRTHNEDWVNYYEPLDHRERARNGCVYLVASGVGGGHISALASRQVVEKVLQTYRAELSADISARLRRAVQEANTLIYRQKQVLSGDANLGTTLVAAVIHKQKAYIANVGNSRAYIVRDAQIQQITQDHSWVAEQFRAGNLTAEQARGHPRRNQLTRLVGYNRTVKVDLFEGDFLPDDVLVLCTKGITTYLRDGEIGGIALKYAPDDAVERLATMAQERGGKYDLSVIVVRALSDEVLSRSFMGDQSRDGLRQRSAKGYIRKIAAGALAAGAIGAILGALWLYQREQPVSAPPETLTVYPVMQTLTPQVSAQKPTEMAAIWKYAMPNLSTPRDKAVLIGRQPVPMLRWQPVGALQVPEWYEVQIGRVGETQPFSRLRVKDGELRVSDAWLPGAYWWRVVVVEVQDSGETTALSPPSMKWEFDWLLDGTSTPTPLNVSDTK